MSPDHGLNEDEAFQSTRVGPWMSPFVNEIWVPVVRGNRHVTRAYSVHGAYLTMHAPPLDGNGGFPNVIK